MCNDILSEVTPLSDSDCFYIVERKKSEFNFPIHTHPEYEINFIVNGGGAIRVVGDSYEQIEDLELVLITSNNLVHGWINAENGGKDIHEITIQFHSDLLAESILDRNQFRSIKTLFEKAQNGVAFTQDAICKVRPLLESLTKLSNGFYSVSCLLNILHELSLEGSFRQLASSSFANFSETYDSRRVQKITEFIHQNYHKKVTLSDVAGLVNMSETSLCRFLKLRTGKSFTDFVTDIRMGHVVRLLVDSTHTISEICYECGFNNLSNFNRVFKKKKGLTPKEFREHYYKTKLIV